MHTEVTVVSRAVKTEIDTKWHRGPCWVLTATVEAYLQYSKLLAWSATFTQRASGSGGSHLVCGLELDFLKNLLRLRLGGSHDSAPEVSN